MNDAAVAGPGRDPSGRLIRSGGRILRIVNTAGAADLHAFASSTAGQLATNDGRVIAMRELAADEVPDVHVAAGDRLFEHPRVDVPSYPAEWPPEMLHAAGRLTLDLAHDLASEGLGLKDATPYNVLFQGPRPVFVDVLSFERRDPGDPTWLAFGQFVRTFLLPLLASARTGLPLDRAFTPRRDGFDVGEVYAMLGGAERLRRPALGLVTIPHLLERAATRRPAIYQPRRLGDNAKAQFMYALTLRRARRLLDKLAPLSSRTSMWTGYGADRPEYVERKRGVIGEMLAQWRPATLLDVGCNEGVFSELAAANGTSVVSIDSDPTVVGALWRRAEAARLPILPLVADMTRPTPASGWRGGEHLSLLRRLTGHFDTLMMLGLIHHFGADGIGAEQVLDLVTDLQPRHAIIEFVARADPFFERIARGRPTPFAGMTADDFASLCARRFTVTSRVTVADTRELLFITAH